MLAGAAAVANHLAAASRSLKSGSAGGTQDIQYCGLLDMSEFVFVASLWPEAQWNSCWLRALWQCICVGRVGFSNWGAAITHSVSIMMTAPACCVSLAQLLPASPIELTCCPARWRRLTPASTSLAPQ